MAYLLFWPLVIWALFSRRPIAIYLFFGAMCFGSLSVIPPNLTGGITILPKMVCGPLLALKMMMRPGGLSEAWTALTHYRRLGLLSLFMLIAVIVTLFAPRLFAGTVEIMGLNTAAREMLRPTGTNISQLIYLFSSYVIAIALFLAMKTAEDRRTVVMAILFGAGVAALTGVLDLATHGTSVLAPFRTAAYAMMTDQEILGSMRIVGLMPEASAYGSICVFFGATLYFLRRADPLEGGWSLPYLGIMSSVLLLAALSTSSTAFLSLGAFGAIVLADWVRRAVGERAHAERAMIFRQFALAAAVVLAIAVMFLLRPEMFKPAINMLDTMVFKKTASSSYGERTMWNWVSLQALAKTYGFGVGVGSTRASSWPVAVISSTGVPGALAMACFLLQAFTRSGKKLEERDRQTLIGAKLALIIAMVPGAAVGTLADFGALNAVLFAMTAALGAQGQPYVGRRNLSPKRRRQPLVRPRFTPRQPLEG